MTSAVGLYLHIPFCLLKCGYCDFNSHASTGELHDAYLAALLEDLKRVRERHGPAEIDTVFIGGGTPSLFSPAMIGSILDRVARDFRLDASEITMEANPGTVERGDFAGYRKAGVTRVSMGAQSFDDSELKLLGRVHNAAEISSAYRAVRAGGIENVNLDLIFALPGQTLDRWRASVDAAVALGPDHISAYNLTYEPGTEFFARLKKGELIEKPDDEQAEFLRETASRLGNAGYGRYEISNFAKPGRECAHNLKYWRREPVLAAGAGAFGFDGKRRWSNVRSPSEYIRRAKAGESLEAFEETPDRGQAMLEFVMCHLRTRSGLPLAGFAGAFGAEVDAAFPRTMRMAREKGLVAAGSDSVRLTDEGILVSDTLFAQFAKELA